MKTKKSKSFIELLDVFRIGLSNGILDKTEIINWADKVIQEDEEPEPIIIDLSLVGHKTINEITTLLNDFIGNEKSEISSRVILGILYQGLVNGSYNLSKVVSTIDWVVWNGKLSEKEKDFLYGLYDDYELAEKKIAGTLEDVKIWTLEALETYKEFKLNDVEGWEMVNKDFEIKIKEKNSNK